MNIAQPIVVTSESAGADVHEGAPVRPRVAGRLLFGALLSLLLAGCSERGGSGAPTEPPTDPLGEGVVLERGDKCGTCSIAIEEVAVLGSASDSLSIGDGSLLAVTPAGCVVGPTDRDGELLMFKDCTGAPHQLGRAGQGPGELGSIRAIAAWPGDSVVAFGYGKMTILSVLSGAGRTVRVDPDTRGQNILVLQGAPLLIVGNDHPARAQFTAVNADGSHHATFGRPPRSDLRADEMDNAVVFGTAGAQEGLWAGSTFYRFRLERWAVAGGPGFLIERTPTWFTPYDSTALSRFWDASAAVMRPLPHLRGIHESADGTLWVAAGVAASGWSPDSVNRAVPRTRNGEAPSRSMSRSDHYDGVIEALDAKSGTHLISIQTPDLWVGFINDSTVYARRESSEGVPQFALYRVRLKR